MAETEVTELRIRIGLLALACVPALAHGQASESLAAAHAGHAALAAGDLAHARSSFEPALKFEKLNASVAYALACVSARSNELEASLAWLEKALDLGYLDAAMLEWDPDVVALRELPRFKALTAAMRQRALEAAVTAAAPLGIEEEASDPLLSATLSIDSDTCRAALGCGDGSVRIIDPLRGTQIGLVNTSCTRIEDVAVSPDLTRVAVACSEGHADVYGIADGARLARFAAYPGGGNIYWPRGAVEWSGDSQRLLTYCNSRRAMLWSVSTSARIAELGAESGSVTRAAWSSDYAWIATASDDGSIHVWDGTSGEARFEPIKLELGANGLCFDPSGERLAVGCADACARIYDLKRRGPALVLSVQDANMFGGLEVGHVEFDPLGVRFLTTSFSFHEIRCWNAKTGEELWRSDFGGGNEGWIGASFSRDGKLVRSNRAGRVLVSESGNVQSEQQDSLQNYYVWCGQDALFRQAGQGIVRRIESESGKTRFTYMARKGGEWLVSTDTAYVGGSLKALRGARVLIGPNPAPLERHAAILFDPKRVHAATQGVAILPSKLE